MVRQMTCSQVGGNVRKTLGIMLGAAVLSMASIGVMATSARAAPKTLKGSFTESLINVPDGQANNEFV